MLVMNVIAEILKREGISTLFCFPTTPIIEAAAAIGIKPVHRLRQRRLHDILHHRIYREHHVQTVARLDVLLAQRNQLPLLPVGLH